jgi:hypothetical protein
MATAIAQVEASDAMIYVVGQGRAVHSKDLQKLLQRITTTSGGRAFSRPARRNSMRRSARSSTIYFISTRSAIRHPTISATARGTAITDQRQAAGSTRFGRGRDTDGEEELAEPTTLIVSEAYEITHHFLVLLLAARDDGGCPKIQRSLLSSRSNPQSFAPRLTWSRRRQRHRSERPADW